MTAILLVLLALPIGGPQQNRLRPQQASMLFDEQHLGKDGMDAFLHPESVTFQRVYPVETADEGSFRVGKWTLHPAGPEHDVPSGTPSLLATVLQTPHFESLTMCLLHPDHVLRFKKGRTTVGIVTCYSCHLLDIALNDKAIGGTDMPGGQPFSDLPGLVTTEEDCLAAWDERFGDGTYANLDAARGATYQRVKVSGQNNFSPVLQLLGESKSVPAADFIKLRTLLLVAPVLQGKMFNDYGMRGPEIAADVLVTMQSSKTVQFLFCSKAFGLHVKVEEGHGNPFPGALQVWEALSEELKRMAAG